MQPAPGGPRGPAFWPGPVRVTSCPCQAGLGHPAMLEPPPKQVGQHGPAWPTNQRQAWPRPANHGRAYIPHAPPWLLSLSPNPNPTPLSRCGAYLALLSCRSLPLLSAVVASPLSSSCPSLLSSPHLPDGLSGRCLPLFSQCQLYRRIPLLRQPLHRRILQISFHTLIFVLAYPEAWPPPTTIIASLIVFPVSSDLSITGSCRSPPLVLSYPHMIWSVAVSRVGASATMHLHVHLSSSGL